MSGKHLQRCLDEFAYRLERRWRQDELFDLVLSCAAGGNYRALAAEPAG